MFVKYNWGTTKRQPAPCHLWTYFCDIFWLEQWRYWSVDILCRDGGILCSGLRVCLPVLQTIAGNLEVDVPSPAPSSILMLRPALGQARVKSWENPAKDSQHQENWKQQWDERSDRSSFISFRFLTNDEERVDMHSGVWRGLHLLEYF